MTAKNLTFTRRFRIIFLLSQCFLQYSIAATDTDIDNEINVLMNRLAEQNCVVIRDDKEYPARKARDNILEKYKLFKEKQPVKSTDEFIEFYATKSAVTGKSLTLKCGEKSHLLSHWLQSDLKKVRKGK